MADGTPSLPQDSVFFNGHGNATDWSDAANWVGGVRPNLQDGNAIFTQNAELDTSFTTYRMMMLGNEAISVKGTLNTTSTNLCTSFMICNGANVTFAPTAVVNDAGGFIVGVHAYGNVTVQSSGSQHAVLNTRDGKIGQHQGSDGHMSIDGSVWNVSDRMFVGLSGIGTLSLTHGSAVSVAACFGVGANLGGHGSVTMSGGSTLKVGTFAVIGGNGIDTDTPAPAGTGIGLGTLTVQDTSAFSAAYSLKIGAGSLLSLQGGSATVGYAGVDVTSGATVSGYGSLSVGDMGTQDQGLIKATGGTLSVQSSITGTGAIQIDANSTLAITGKTIGVPTIAFTGSDGTLSLSTGIADHATITGFAAGDSIAMAGVDGMSWNASTDVLTLTSGTHVVDTLQFAGSYGGNAFTLTQTGGHALIGLSSVASPSLVHH